MTIPRRQIEVIVEFTFRASRKAHPPLSVIEMQNKNSVNNKREKSVFKKERSRCFRDEFTFSASERAKPPLSVIPITTTLNQKREKKE
jgi:hypothetical protein